MSHSPGLGPEGAHLLGKMVKNRQVKKDLNASSRTIDDRVSVEKFIEGLGDAKIDYLNISSLYDTDCPQPLFRSLLDLLPHVENKLICESWMINESQQQELQQKLNEIGSPSLEVIMGNILDPTVLKASLMDSTSETSDEASTSGTGIVIPSGAPVSPEKYVLVRETKPESTISEKEDAGCAAVETDKTAAPEAKKRTLESCDFEKETAKFYSTGGNEAIKTTYSGTVIPNEISLASEQSVHETKPESSTLEEEDADCGAVEKAGTSDETSTSGTSIVRPRGTSFSPKQSENETNLESTTAVEGGADRVAIEAAAKLSAEIERRIKTESTKSKSIGAAGGVLVNFGSKVTFSREAYNKDTKVQTSVITDFSDCPSDKVPIAPSIKCSPSGKLNKAALVEIDHWAFPTGGDFYVDIYRKDDENSERRFFKKVRIEGNGKISFHTDHFSIYSFFVKCALWVRDKVMGQSLPVAVQNNVYIKGTTRTIVCVCSLKDEKVKDDVIQSLKSQGFVPLLPVPENTRANCGEEVKIAIKCQQPQNLRIIPNDSQNAEPTVREDEEKFPIDEIIENCQKLFYLRIGLKEGNLTTYKGLLDFLYSHTAHNKVTHPMSTPWPIIDTQPVVAQHQSTTNIITAKTVNYGEMNATDSGAMNRITSESQTGNEASEQNVRQQGGATSNVTAMTYNMGQATRNEHDTTNQVSSKSTRN